MVHHQGDGDVAHAVHDQPCHKQPSNTSSFFFLATVVLPASTRGAGAVARQCTDYPDEGHGTQGEGSGDAYSLPINFSEAVSVTDLLR